MLELPLIGRQMTGNQLTGDPSQALRPCPVPTDADVLTTDWSADEELAALETVWESLCQDAVSTHPPLRLPQLPPSRRARIDLRHPRRGSERPDGPPGRMAS